MQPVTVLAVGKLTGFCALGVEEYAKRLRGLCRFDMVEIAAVPPEGKNPSPAAIATALNKEAEGFLAALPKGAALVALCVEGRQQASETFAEWLSQAAGSGTPGVAFAVGSSYGLGPAVKRAAGLRLSLGAITLPHQLARLVLCEQLYRAMTIRQNGRYHK